MTHRTWIVILLVTSTAAASAQFIVRHENQPTSLEGTIRLVHGYRPPGYGETPKRDAHVSYGAIETATPVKAMPDPNAGFDCHTTKRLNLFIEGDGRRRIAESPAAKWKNRQVTINGVIHCAETAGEMTPLYMDVSNIAAARN